METLLPDRRPSVAWRWRLQEWVSRLVATPGFRRWAAAFPLTRPVARRRARALFDLCAGFVYSQVLSACVRLRLFELLADGPLPAAEVARLTSLPLESAQRLLRAAASLGLVALRGDDHYGLGPLGASLLGNDGVLAMVEHHELLYADLADPVALLRGQVETTRLGAYWPYAESASPAALDAAQVAAYSRLMAVSQSLIAEEVTAAYPLERHRCLLEVGGGEGVFAAAAAAAAPRLQVILFDLPAVAARARTRLADSGFAARVQVVGGDFLADPLPQGADVASLVRVLFDHADERALAILRAVRRALAPGATLLLAEPMAGTAGAEPMGDAYFGFYLLAMGRGRSRTPAEIGRLLERAGFSAPRLLHTRMPLQTRLLVARAVSSTQV